MLAHRRRARIRAGALLAARPVCRAAYCAAAIVDPPGLLLAAALPPDDPDDVFLEEALLRAEAERSSIQRAHESIMSGARRALLRTDDGAGSTPRCPRGHCLGVFLAPPGTECSICGRAASRPFVVFQCSIAGCFNSCARAAGCAPTSLVMVTSALDKKFDPGTGWP